MKITTTTYTGWSVPVEYRIDHEQNGQGRDRWVVRYSDFDTAWGRRWELVDVYRSEKRAKRRLERLQKALAENTWAMPDRGGE